jgi:predicted porin
VTDDDNNQKPRVVSIAASYVNGPLGIGLAWEKHYDFGTLGAARDLDDRGWGGSIAYTFGGNVKLGATFLDRRWETAPGAHTKKRSATVGIDWRIAGPHSVSAQYAWAGNSRGDGGAIGGNGGANLPGSQTGADAISIAYQYDFSKRTSVKLGYVRVDNDRNSTSGRIGNTPALIGGGQNVDAWAFLVKHNF